MLNLKYVDFQFNIFNNVDRIVEAIEQFFARPIHNPLKLEIATQYTEDENATKVGTTPNKKVVRKRVTQVRVEPAGPMQYSFSLSTDLFDESGEYERTIVHAGHIKLGPNPSIGFVERMF